MLPAVLVSHCLCGSKLLPNWPTLAPHCLCGSRLLPVYFANFIPEFVCDTPHGIVCQRHISTLTLPARPTHALRCSRSFKKLVVRAPITVLEVSPPIVFSNFPRVWSFPTIAMRGNTSMKVVTVLLVWFYIITCVTNTCITDMLCLLALRHCLINLERIGVGCSSGFQLPVWTNTCITVF